MRRAYNNNQPMCYLPNEIKLKIFSFLSNKDLCNVASLNKEYNEAARWVWAMRLKNEFCYEYDYASNIHPKLIYEKIIDHNFIKNRELFISVIKLNKYFEFVTKINDNWEYDHMPIAGLIRMFGLEAISRSDIIRAQLTDTAFDSLLTMINTAISTMLEQIVEMNKGANHQYNIIEVIKKIDDESTLFFQQLYENPLTMSSIDLYHSLLLLCSLNSHEVIRRFCKKYPSLVNVSLMLPEALRGLNLETVKVLIEGGADVSMNTILYRDVDRDQTLYGSPLLYPFLALMYFGPNRFLNVPPEPFVASFRADHPKLIAIMIYLLECGANPEQKIFSAPYKMGDLDLSSPEVEILDNNFKKIAKEILDEFSINSQLRSWYDTPMFLDFLTKIATWSPATQFKKQDVTLLQIQTFNKFVEEQQLDQRLNIKNDSRNQPSEEMKEIKDEVSFRM